MHMAHLKDRYITMRWRYEYGCSKDRNIRASCVPYESMNNSLSADWSRTSCEPLWTSCLIRQKGSREQSGNSKCLISFSFVIKNRKWITFNILLRMEIFSTDCINKMDGQNKQNLPVQLLLDLLPNNRCGIFASYMNEIWQNESPFVQLSKVLLLGFVMAVSTISTSIKYKAASTIELNK